MSSPQRYTSVPPPPQSVHDINYRNDKAGTGYAPTAARPTTASLGISPDRLFSVLQDAVNLTGLPDFDDDFDRIVPIPRR